MTPTNLEDVESYLLKHPITGGGWIDERTWKCYIRQTFAELRAREEAKEKVAQDRFSALREEKELHAE